MSSDIFGNLREWDSVPDTLMNLVRSRSLAEHEDGLIRILRYRQNWRLREMVLHVLGQIEKPSQRLLQAVLDLLADDTLYYQVRVLAAETFAKLAEHRFSCDDLSVDVEVQDMVNRLEALHDRPQEPVLRSAMERCLETARNALVHV